MPLKKLLILLLPLTILTQSCHTHTKNTYAIRDFSPSIQPNLTTIVSKQAFVDDSIYTTLQNRLTDAELVKLSQSEHPALRLLALLQMTQRPSFDHFSVIMSHLDDTAIVSVDRGEWGIQFRTVADYMIENAHWKTQRDKERTIDELIRHHNHLKSAFTGLAQIKSDVKYYPFVKEMAQQERNFEEREDALYALAEYKKKEDIPLIKEVLSSHLPEMTQNSFWLIKNFPDTAYMKILCDYFPRTFYRLVCQGQSTDKAIAYYNAVAVYKNDSSAKILTVIFNRKPFMSCPIDTLTLKQELDIAIWDNDCPAYALLRKRIKDPTPVPDTANTDIPALPVDSNLLRPDHPSEPIGWW